MVQVDLVGLIAGGQSGIPRYAVALTRALDRVAAEFPELSLRLVTTGEGAGRIAPRTLPVYEVDGARAGGGRIVAEQLAARRSNADLLHFYDLTGPVLAPGRRFVTTMHDAAVRRGYERLRTAHKRVLQPWAIRHAAITIAVSGFARAEAIELFGARPGAVRVVHSGPGLGNGSGPAEPATTEAATSRHESKPFALYVGNISEHKNLPFLIRAWERARVEARLVLVGGRGAHFAAVERAIAASPVRDSIEIRRDVSDAALTDLYRGAAMLLLPSRYEGFGFTSLEAMAHGCPVVESDIPALREVSGDGARLVAPDDLDGWADAIRLLLSDPKARRNLVTRGLETVRRYSWEATARGVCRVLAEAGGAGVTPASTPVGR